jgi:hypothetical protein
MATPRSFLGAPRPPNFLVRLIWMIFILRRLSVFTGVGRVQPGLVMERTLVPGLP